MSVKSKPNVDHIAYGSLDMLRECAAECLAAVNFYSGMAADYAAAIDDAGLEYSTRRAAASLRQAVGILAMLKDAKATAAQRRGTGGGAQL
jgi:hypothetical protein